MLVESRFIFICNIPPSPPPPLPFGRLLIHTWSYFRNSDHKTNSLIITEYSRRSLKLLPFLDMLDSGVWRNLWSVSFLSGRWQRRGINVTVSLNHWPCIFWPLLCRTRIYGVYGQPLLQWSTTESQGLIQKFPCTICTSRSIQRKNIHFDFGKINML